MTVIHKTKIFDSVDGFSPFIDVGELTDATVTKRRDQWWIFLAGEVNGHEGIQLFSASLPPRNNTCGHRLALNAASARSQKSRSLGDA
jgi:hypothetical protein